VLDDTNKLLRRAYDIKESDIKREKYELEKIEESNHKYQMLLVIII